MKHKETIINIGLIIVMWLIGSASVLFMVNDSVVGFKIYAWGNLITAAPPQQGKEETEQ